MVPHSWILECARMVGVGQNIVTLNPVAHHKHLHVEYLTLYCLTRSVAASQLDMTQTNQKLAFRNHKTTIFYNKIIWSTVSKAFFKSINTAPT